MIFADKIIRLRKKNGWSQEELAEKMDTSRQAVSKWEGAQSVPDIGKILQLAQLFGVTTDYLLKDEIEDEEYTSDTADTSVRKITMADADTYLGLRLKAAVRIAVATFLCILAPVTLILLGAASEYPENNISENFAGAIGLITLFLLAAVAVVMYIYTGFTNAPYEFLDKEPFINEYGVQGMVREKQKAFQNRYMLLNIVGAALCILSPVPLFIGAFSGDGMFTVIMLSVLMVIAGIGVAIFIYAGVIMASMRRLLKEGEFSSSEKKTNQVVDAVSSIYWLVAVAGYLAYSFITNDWDKSWIVWPVAGVLYAVVATVCNLITKKDSSDK